MSRKAESRSSLPARAAWPRLAQALRELALNLHWTWDAGALELFRRLDDDGWERSGHSPLALVEGLPADRQAKAARDPAFRRELRQALGRLGAYLGESGEASSPPVSIGGLVAYFSAEFGLAECLPIYAGGLGILAGDHLKAASDLGLPVVGVGLLYREGYFQQELSSAGEQIERYRSIEPDRLPLSLERDRAGRPMEIEVELPGRAVLAQIWRAQVGRVALYLLDAHLAKNQPGDQAITARLYGGDLDMRVRQEMLLGVGGVRALERLGLEPAVYHMNEGHSAFLALELMRRRMAARVETFDEARAAVSSRLIFTTHTPVSAGIDRFPIELVLTYLDPLRHALGISQHDFLGLGREHPEDQREWFNLASLALRVAARRNGVSRLHGRVANQMWAHLWPEGPDPPQAGQPIGSVTNGVHTTTWTAPEFAALYDRWLGPAWRARPDLPQHWSGLRQIPLEDLWQARAKTRERLIEAIRRRLGQPDALDPGTLTVGFARRFATYKRANLILRDPDRLGALLKDEARPMQLVFAGKAHPRDEPGKDVLKAVASVAGREEFRRRVVLLPDYDVWLAKLMVQGADVWLNNPVRPQEASGTSGMKAALNGALNLSVLDGWWDEAYRPGLGWAFGSTDGDWSDPEQRDRADAAQLYELLEREVVPLYSTRDANGLPRAWLERVRDSIATLCPVFSTHRMVLEYAERYYSPLASRSEYAR